MDSHTRPHSQPRPAAGYSLIEILVAMSILITSLISIPSLYRIIVTETVVSELNQVSGLLQTARLFAINHQVTVVVCPTKDNVKCTDNWSLPVMAFEDGDADGVRDTNEQDIEETIIAQVNRANNIRVDWNRGGKVTFFGERQMASNGTMLFCPTDGSYQDQARTLVISNHGRIRLGGNANCDDSE